MIATNELNRLDSAILRTGRLDIHLELKLPNTQVTSSKSKL
jgi:ATP-dependent 26S proteasome regulatory subunit